MIKNIYTAPGKPHIFQLISPSYNSDFSNINPVLYHFFVELQDDSMKAYACVYYPEDNTIKVSENEYMNPLDMDKIFSFVHPTTNIPKNVMVLFTEYMNGGAKDVIKEEKVPINSIEDMF